MDLEPDFNLHSWQQELIAKVLENTEVTTPAKGPKKAPIKTWLP
jgi:hypothetical protein